MEESLHHHRLRDVAGIILVILFLALTVKTFVLDAIQVPSQSMESTLFPGDFVFVNKLIYGAKSPKYFPFIHSAIPFLTLPAFRSVARGDVIVFELPRTSNSAGIKYPVYFVKRCLGIAGDTIMIGKGKIMIANGNISYQCEFKDTAGIEPGPLVIPKRGARIGLTLSGISGWERIIQDEGHRVEVSGGAILVDGSASTSYTIEKNYLFVLGDNIDHSYDSRFWGFLPEDNVIGKTVAVYWSIIPHAAGWNLSDLFTSIRWNRIGTFVH